MSDERQVLDVRTADVDLDVGAVNFTEDGQFHSILDAMTIQHLVNQLTEARGLDQINYIGGGEAGFTAPQKT